jgi:hypothetical protein
MERGAQIPSHFLATIGPCPFPAQERSARPILQALVCGDIPLDCSFGVAKLNRNLFKQTQ